MIVLKIPKKSKRERAKKNGKGERCYRNSYRGLNVNNKRYIFTKTARFLKIISPRILNIEKRKRNKRSSVLPAYIDGCGIVCVCVCTAVVNGR